MRKLLFVVLSLLLLASAAMAQGKVETKWKCQKPTAEHQFNVGDMPDYTYSIAQGTCSATSSGKDFAEKTGEYTEFDETWKASMTGHGRYNVTMDNGDKVYYTYETSGPTEIGKPLSNKWKINSGTGKYKGIKGSGACSGKRSADGSSTWECSGTYSMGK